MTGEKQRTLLPGTDSNSDYNDSKAVQKFQQFEQKKLIWMSKLDRFDLKFNN